MAKINLEKFILDLIDIINMYGGNNECVDVHCLIGALKRQGLKVSRNGELMDVNEKEPVIPSEFLIYNEKEDKWECSTEMPPLDKTDWWIMIEGTNKYIRKSDYVVHTIKQMADKSGIK